MQLLQMLVNLFCSIEIWKKDIQVLQAVNKYTKGNKQYSHCAELQHIGSITSQVQKLC